MRAANRNRQPHYAINLAERTADASSVWRFTSWYDLCEAFERAGYTERQAETILRSKITRWAADHFETAGHRPDAKDMMAFMALQSDNVRKLTGVRVR